MLDVSVSQNRYTEKHKKTTRRENLLILEDRKSSGRTSGVDEEPPVLLPHSTLVRVSRHKDVDVQLPRQHTQHLQEMERDSNQAHSRNPLV